MGYIIGMLFGIFVGIAVAGYMFINEINRKDRFINKVVYIMNRKDIIFVDKYDKIKELVCDYQSKN